MNHEGFGDLIDHGHARVKAPVGVLIDHLKRRALLAPLGRARFGELFVLEAHRPFGRTLMTQDEASERRFAAARFAHEAHDFARTDLQVDVLQHVPGREASEEALSRVVAVTLHAHVRNHGEVRFLRVPEGGVGEFLFDLRFGFVRERAAGLPVIVVELLHRVEGRSAALRRAGAAARKGAALSQLVGRRNFARNGRERPARRRHVGHGVQKPFGIGVRRVRNDLADRALFQDVPRVHDGDVVGDVVREVQVVRDEKHRHPARKDEFAQFGQKFSLHHDVERRRRFVGEKKFRRAHEGERDHDALAHAARELMGIGVHALFGRRDPDRFEVRERDVAQVRLVRRAAGAVVGMTEANGFDELFADRAHGVQGAHGVLHDHADFGAADRAVFLFGEAHEFAVFKADASRRAAFAAGETQDRAREDALARARLADQSVNDARAHVQIDAVEHFHGPEGDAQIPNAQKGRRRGFVWGHKGLAYGNKGPAGARAPLPGPESVGFT